MSDDIVDLDRAFVKVRPPPEPMRPSKFDFDSVHSTWKMCLLYLPVWGEAQESESGFGRRN